MKPLVPVAVALNLALALPALHASGPTHPLQPGVPRTVSVSESQTPPVIRAGLLQSTLIVLPPSRRLQRFRFPGGATSGISSHKLSH